MNASAIAADVARSPLVRAVLDRFPGARIVNVRPAPGAPAASPAPQVTPAQDDVKLAP